MLCTHQIKFTFAATSGNTQTCKEIEAKKQTWQMCKN